MVLRQQAKEERPRAVGTLENLFRAIAAKRGLLMTNPNLRVDGRVDAHSARRLSFITSDPSLGTELFDKLAKLAEGSS